MNIASYTYNPYQNIQNAQNMCQVPCSFLQADHMNYIQDNSYGFSNNSQIFDANSQGFSNSQASNFSNEWSQQQSCFNNNSSQMVQSLPIDVPCATTPEQVYSKYEDLPNFGSDVNISAVIGQIYTLFQDKTNWKNTFDAIDNLRILNKYYTHELNAIVVNFWKSILECLESAKTFVSKNALIFVTEVFQNSKNVRLQDEIINGLVPIVLVKASSEKGVLKKEAQEALRELSTNCCFDSTVVILCRESLGKVASVNNIAILTLTQILNNIGENISKLDQQTILCLTKTLATTLNTGKLANMKKLAGMICVYICKLYGFESYANLIRNCNLSQAEQLEMAKVVEKQKGAGVRNSFAFRELVHETKKQIKNSTIGYTHPNGSMNTMINPDGPFSNLASAGKDAGMINSMYSKPVNNENNFLQASNAYNSMNNFNTSNSAWNGSNLGANAGYSQGFESNTYSNGFSNGRF